MTPAMRVNGEEMPLLPTVAALMQQKGIVPRRGVAVALNGVVVPASAWESARIAPGDEIEIVRPFGGG